MQEDLHEGHRDRLINKFNEFPDSFSEHELLEIFLFTVIPRKDTNNTAHRLLQAFGSIKRVFSATPEQLMTVKGVGKAVAAQIVLSGKLMKKISETSSENSDKEFISLEKTRSAIISLFRGVKSEKFYFFLLNDAFQKVFCLEYSGNSDDSVFADTSEIARAMSVHKAKYAIMAHNHPSGNENPSETDDVATVKFYIVCDVYGINLVDHIIVTEKNTYSYFANGRLSFIKEKADIEKLIKK